MKIVPKSHLAPETKVPCELNAEHPSVIIVAESGEIFRVHTLCVAQYLVPCFPVNANDGREISFIFSPGSIYSKIVAMILDRWFPLEYRAYVVGLAIDMTGAGARA